MFAPRAAPRAAAAPPSPVGRWDEVMALRPNWIIDVLDAEGDTHTGRFVRASVRSLRLVKSGGELELPRREVVRVDLLHAQDTPGTTAREIGTGAAAGAATMAGGAMLIPFLLTGKVFLPPARFLAAGAVLGGVTAAGELRHERRPRTVYVARIGD
jgi:hypothetical protein